MKKLLLIVVIFITGSVAFSQIQTTGLNLKVIEI